MRTFLALFLAIGLAACTSPEQKYLEQTTSYSDTLKRVDKYVHLPECVAPAEADCHDPVAKAELKTVVAGHVGGDPKAANADVAAALIRHDINCGPAATDTCP